MAWWLYYFSLLLLVWLATDPGLCQQLMLSISHGLPPSVSVSSGQTNNSESVAVLVNKWSGNIEVFMETDTQLFFSKYLCCKYL